MNAKERQDITDFKEWLLFRLNHHNKLGNWVELFEGQQIFEQFNKLFKLNK